MTTAELRKGAQQAERNLLWLTAAAAWDAAAEQYPNPIGQLAQRDIARMKERAENCRRTSREERAASYP